MKILNILAAIFYGVTMVLLILRFTSVINMNTLYPSSSLLLGSLFLISAILKRKQAMQNITYDNADELEYDDYNIEKQSQVGVVGDKYNNCSVVFRGLLFLYQIKREKYENIKHTCNNIYLWRISLAYFTFYIRNKHVIFQQFVNIGKFVSYIRRNKKETSDAEC